MGLTASICKISTTVDILLIQNITKTVSVRNKTVSYFHTLNFNLCNLPKLCLCHFAIWLVFGVYSLNLLIRKQISSKWL